MSKIRDVTAVAVLLAVALALIPNIAGASTTTTSIYYGVFPPAGGMSIAIIAVLIVIFVAAFVYMLGSTIYSQNAKNWAKVQIYEALISLMLLAIFLGLFYVFLINPVNAYNSVGLLPKECNTASINTLFSLSACDIGTFTNNAFSYFEFVDVLALVAGQSPGFSLGLQPILGLKISTTLNSVYPAGLEGYIGLALSGLVFMLVLNNLQLLLISGSILFLTFFLTIGLIARVFGFTRTFGGAMIAFGLGLGIVYPLLISITYGFINVNMLSGAGLISILPAGIADFLEFVATGTVSLIPTSIISGFGYAIVGLTFIPFINFVILDAFIIDFSKAVGERVSFMELLSNFI
ncbi:hypothetical protein M1373_01475 [Candidatus Marsarchaeota archaeon]|nr:hypothetical protein [Candidatus Marsarchaeota archaeon]MCL5404968.1 hypothetical protein [Candidatus Marsarchaeota archaeon]